MVKNNDSIIVLTNVGLVDGFLEVDILGRKCENEDRRFALFPLSHVHEI
jgi:hypothetical protein